MNTPGRQKRYIVYLGIGTTAHAIPVTATDSLNALCAAVSIAMFDEMLPHAWILYQIQAGSVRIKPERCKPSCH